ncbi:MAG: GNAT family N-acetyltransferase [Sphingobacteriaceae bacterium]|nr:GNAT family N-acetyltransferase [Sphingobacteriaceae bacterium]
MFLKSKNISLRAVEPNDADILYHWENDRSIWAVSNTQIPFSKFVLDEFTNSAHQDIYTNKQLRLMADEISTGDTIGCVDIFEFDPQHARAGIGIYIHKDFREKGYASECLQLVVDYCFNTLHLKQIYSHINASNLASINLFVKNGFEKGVLKKAWHKTSLHHFEDVWFLQLINYSD